MIAFYSAKDIPGKNSFTSKDVPWIGDNEEIFATAVVYYGQPIGVIAAVTRKLALSAVELVKVKYKKSDDKLILQVRDALNAPDKERRVRDRVKLYLIHCLPIYSDLQISMYVSLAFSRT